MTRYYSATAQDTTVTSAITSSSTTVVVGATTNFPTQYPFILALDFGAASEELVAVTGASGLTLSISRGFNGSTAQSHSTGAVVRHVAVAQDFTDAQNHYATALTAGAHGVTGALATFLGSPSSANFASYLTDETGSGPAVFATGPTISSPIITGTIAASGSTGSAGQFLSSTGTGIAWAAAATPNFAINAQTGTTYTLVASDANKLVTATNSGSTITVTIPAAVFSVGQSVNITQLGAAQVIFQGDGTSTVYSTPGLKLRAQYSVASVACIATNTFLLVGDLTA